MSKTIRFRLIGVSIFFLFLGGYEPVWSQWAGTYGNEWMTPGKTYLKVLVSKQGMNRISISSLPKEFPVEDISKIQIWHRGKQVSARITSRDIIFYGEKNDGASDSLVYRPASARMNPNISLFSDKGAYFLTTSESGKRIAVKNYSQPSVTPVSYHLAEDVYTFTNQFAFTTGDIKAALNKSYYEAVNTWTGSTFVGVNTSVGAYKDTVLVQSIVLKNFIDVGLLPNLEMLFTGHNVGDHSVQIYVGKSNSSKDLRKLGSVNYTGFNAKKGSFSLQPGDLNLDGSGVIKIKSETNSNSGDWYSLSYYKISYPQSLDMQGKSSATFTIKEGDDLQSLIEISNSNEGLAVYDITDKNIPVQLESKFVNGINRVVIDRIKAKKSVLLAYYTSDITEISASEISTVNFQPIYPKQTAVGTLVKPADFDYLIVTNKVLANGVLNYADYRSSASGGGHRVLVMDINEIYNQFNYGEPSPVALKRFVSYMLKDGVRDAHNLLLIGYSVSIPRLVVKELPNEIPTFGDPGSDMLLVSGINGTSPDTPIIPVGRINAYSVDEVNAYLNKVKLYEADIDEGWKKRILHMNGGHSQSEVNQLKAILSDLAPIVENGEVGGYVKALVKSNPSPSAEKIDIKDDINEGVGMLTFFGHGAQNITDLDFGAVSDVSRGYIESEKYTAMFFNGCGVGNIFTSRGNKHAISDDWLLTSNKGAIAVIANSYDSYVSSSTSYLKHLYSKLFGEKTTYTVGEAVRQVALAMLNEGAGDYEIANFQQSNLQGDPVIKLIRVGKPDFAISDPDIFLFSDNNTVSLENSKNPKIAIIRHNLGRYLPTEKPVTRIHITKKDGSSNLLDINSPAVAYSDTVWVPISNLSSVSNIHVKLDPQNLVSELSKNNNDAELEVDWELAKSQSIFSNGLIKDEVAPQIFVTFNNRRISSEEMLAPNPEIEIMLMDDRAMKLDSSLINVYIRSCFEVACSFRRISYQSLSLSSSEDGKALTITYNGDLLTDGEYEILITAKDDAGNAVINPYQIRLRIGNSANGLSLICFPNPASEYVKFQLKAEDSKSIHQIKWQIYNQRGQKVDEGLKKVGSAELVSWYWIPSGSDGIYIYRAIISSNDGEKEITGKISLIR